VCGLCYQLCVVCLPSLQVAELWKLPSRLLAQRESRIGGGQNESGVRAEREQRESRFRGDSSDEPGRVRSQHEEHEDPEPNKYRTEIFARRYSRTTRPWINFHRDACAFTVNVALGSDSQHTGGRLLAIFGDGLQTLPRESGDVTVHPSSLLHAVSAGTGCMPQGLWA